MARGNFEKAHAVTAKWEGGWSNHAADPGGKTMYGVTEAVYHAWLKRRGQAIRPVRNIAMSEALAIYREEYWARVGAETLVPGVDLAAYDVAVNSGVSRGRKWLLASLDKRDRHDVTVKTMCAKRTSFLRGLTNWKVFGKGWSNRIADIEAKGVAWALAFMAAPKAVVAFPTQAPRPTMQQEREIVAKLDDTARQAGNAAAAQKKGAAATGAGGAGSGGAAATGVDPSTMPDWGLVAIVAGIVALIVLAVYLAHRSRNNGSREVAYRRAATEIETNALG